MQAAEELLEDRRLANDHVDEIDAALGRVVPAAHRHERRDRMRLVGQEDVLVRRDDVQRQRDGEQDDPQREEPAGGDALHRSPRELPPSTRTVVPVMYAARAEATKHTTSPNSRGLPSRPSGICASSSAGGPSGPVELGHARRVDASGRDTVDGDRLRPELPGECLRPAGEARPNRVRQCQVRRRLLDGDRGDEDDTAGLALSDVRQRQPHEPHRGLQQELERGFELEVGDLRRRPGRRAARVPHEDVDPAEGLDRFRDEPLEVGGVRHVAPHGRGPRCGRRHARGCRGAARTSRRSRPRPRALPRKPARDRTKLHRRSPSCRADPVPSRQDGSAPT